MFDKKFVTINSILHNLNQLGKVGKVTLLKYINELQTGCVTDNLRLAPVTQGSVPGSVLFIQLCRCWT